MVSGTSDRESAAEVAARNVAESLNAAEAAVDAALNEARTLTSMLPASAPVAAPVSALGRARIRLARAHRSLSDLARRVGLDEATVGPLDKPEDTPPIGGGPRRRRPAPPHPG